MTARSSLCGSITTTLTRTPAQTTSYWMRAQNNCGVNNTIGLAQTLAKTKTFTDIVVKDDQLTAVHQ